jgi:hypothetical protein
MRVSPNSLAVTTAFGLGVLLASLARGQGPDVDVGRIIEHPRTVARQIIKTSHDRLATIIGFKSSR